MTRRLNAIPIKKFQKGKNGFIPLPLILGIIFIVLLGGVGLGIIQTEKKISESVSEIQKLETERKYDEAIQILETLENNFFVKYFGFKKGEIDNEVEKIKSAIQEIEEEQTKEVQQPSVEEYEIQQPLTKENEGEIVFFDCGDSLDCLIEKAKICSLAKVKSNISVEAGSYFVTVSFYGEIRGKEKEKCIFYIRAEKLLDLVKKDEIPSEIEKDKILLKSLLD